MKNIINLLVLFAMITTISCQNDDAANVVYQQGTNEFTNQWMYGQMKKYYYWNETMPGLGDLSLNPKEYFASLLHTGDRFSYALHPAKAETFPQSMRSRYGFDISFIEFQGQVYGAVLYTLSGSPAQNYGLQRGDLIKSINGIIFNRQNYPGLYSDLVNSEQAMLLTVKYNHELGFTEARQVNILRGLTFGQPIVSKVIVSGTNKVGYIQIPHFDIGLAQSLIQVFSGFKSQSVNTIVVDLRYNGGGDVSSATALSIILAPNIQADDLFITFKGNKNGGNISQSFVQALQMNENNVSFAALRAAHPSLRKLYVLCGSHTASASEIIINNLKPFMEVIAIGEKTIGKDVAGFPVEDDRIPGQQGWTLYPSIYKLFNANNEGNYSGGIDPSIEVDELRDAEIFALGDVREVVLNRALNVISGNGRIMQPRTTLVLPGTRCETEPDPLLQINL